MIIGITQPIFFNSNIWFIRGNNEESKQYGIQKGNHDLRSSIGSIKKPGKTLSYQDSNGILKMESSKKLVKQLDITDDSNKSLNSSIPNQKSPKIIDNEAKNLSNKRALTQSNFAIAKTLFNCSIRPGQPAKVRISIPSQRISIMNTNNTIESKLNEDCVFEGNDGQKSQEILIDHISKFIH